MGKHCGEASVVFENPPIIISAANITGPKEGEGWQGDYIDEVLADNLADCESWEKCESHMIEKAIRNAAAKIKIGTESLDFVLAGDLLNQLMSTHFAMRSLARPFLGLYGACSTMAESMLIGAMMVDGGFASRLACGAASHHDAAERQYRFPTELGSQRPPSTQWTVTGAGSTILSKHGFGPVITRATVGKVVDYGVKDTNSLGAAMAPAAAETIVTHLRDFNLPPDYYDMIFTGDLGAIGKNLVLELCRDNAVDLEKNYQDCGCMIYKEGQDTHSGASGCASSAIVFCGYIYRHLLLKTFKKILLVGTGSLHSPTSYQQSESIPCIAHAVAVELMEG
jgi:stage V sporulation protein AD